MTALPESIGNITSLLSISLQYTNIAGLPASIGNLKNLLYLGVYGYQNEYQFVSDGELSPDYYPDYLQDANTEKRSPFTGLPETASKLSSLKQLEFNNSEIKSLPDYLSELPALRKIEVIDCDIKTIPPALQRLVDSGELAVIRSEDELYEYQWQALNYKIKPRRR